MSEEIRVLIVEDEDVWAIGLTANLTDFGYTVAGRAGDFESAVLMLNTCEYDVVLMDINLHGRNTGIELGKMMHDVYHKPFIFITASFDKHTTDEAVKARPSAYLTKPVNPTSLVVAIQAALNNFSNRTFAVTPNVREEEKTFFFVKHGSKHKKIEWKNVVYLRSDNKYTAIYNAPDKTEYFIRSTMPKTLSYIVPEAFREDFVQVNRAEVLHLPFITELAGDEIITQFRAFSVSPAHLNELKRVLRLIS